MPVKSTFHQQARQRQLIDLAIEVISERGLAGASNSEIARRAGVSRGVVNYNIGDRDTFIGLVVARVYDLGAQAVGPTVEAADGPCEALRAFVTASLEFYAAQPAAMRALREIFSAPGPVERATTQEYRREVHDVSAIIEHGQRDGVMTLGDTDLAVGVLRAALDWGASALNDDKDPSHVRDEVLSVVERALAVESTT